MSYDPEDYEHYEEWCNRDPELAHMSLEEFDEMRCIEDYGDNFSIDDDDDSYDNY